MLLRAKMDDVMVFFFIIVVLVVDTIIVFGMIFCFLVRG